MVANTTGTARTTTAATDWACTRDNVTGLTWSLQTQSATWATATGATYPDAGHNTPARCGFSSGWRMPVIKELVNLTHYGAGGWLDLTYFPQTEFERYWSSDNGTGFGSTPSLAWALFHHELGGPQKTIKTFERFVRLVHSSNAPPAPSFTDNG
ncbi:MAG: DUF1566 domain-containing protein, partial [Casimicrobium sp.]